VWNASTVTVVFFFSPSLRFLVFFSSFQFSD
jgi:hypothetical protein